jgi:choline dehydrogenase-like flavoprotein
MEIDLNRLPLQTNPIHAQVCIVGAGIAGIALAWRLAHLGIDVALLEAGGRALTGPDQSSLAAAQLTGHPHLGTTQGRFRVFGGSSLAWGGQLLPLPHDAGWPVSEQELTPYTQQAERLLGVDDLPYDAPAFFPAAHLRQPALLHLPGWRATLSKWTPFARRNLATTVGPALSDPALLAGGRVRVYLHAAVTELLPSASGQRIDSLLARDSASRSVRFTADQFVVAAGTVESSRLLLASRSVLPAGIGNAHGQVGRNFHDHLTLPIAHCTGPARESLLHNLRPWVMRRHGHTTLHSAKLEHPSGHSIQAHLTLEDPEDSALAALRARWNARQRGVDAPNVRLLQLPAAAREIVHLAWSAAVECRRYVPATTRAALVLNAAQPTPTRSRISLSDAVDAAGMPQAIVDWRIEPEELAALRSFSVSLRAALEAALDDRAGLHWVPELFAADGPLPDLRDARHAMGGLCMGTDPATSVVDPALAVHGMENLSVASAAVFPNGAPAMPALPLLALTLRLADRLAVGLEGRP